MTRQDDQSASVDNMTGVKEYAELLRDSKQNADFYKLLSVAMASYADGAKNVLRCMTTAQANAL